MYARRIEPQMAADEEYWADTGGEEFEAKPKETKPAEDKRRAGESKGLQRIVASGEVRCRRYRDGTLIWPTHRIDWR